MAKKEKCHVPNQSVNFGRLDVIQLLHRILNLPLIRLEVGDKNEGIVLLDLLHRGLGIQRPRRRGKQ